MDPLLLVFAQFVSPHSIPKIFFHLEIGIKGQQVSKTLFSQTSKTFVRGAGRLKTWAPSQVQAKRATFCRCYIFVIIKAWGGRLARYILILL